MEIPAHKVVQEIRGLMDLALSSGTSFSPRDRQTLEAALDDLDAAQLDESLRMAYRFLERPEPPAVASRSG